METVMIDVLDEESLTTDESTWVGPRMAAPSLPPILLAAIAASREARRLPVDARSNDRKD